PHGGQTMLRTLAAVALATSVVAVAAPAQAQENTARPMGLRLELGWAGNTNLAGLGSTGNQPNVSATPIGDIRVGYDLGQFTPLIGLSFVNRSADVTEDDAISTTVFVLDI